MKVFISWSGPRSRQVAEALHGWLKPVLQRVDPWISPEDIHGGSNWDHEVRGALDGADFGIICVTAENIEAPWLNYEAGALAEKLGRKACPYLFRMTPNELPRVPLARLQ